VNAARSIAIAIFPFIPESSQRIWNQLGLDGMIKDYSWSDMSKLEIASGHMLGESSPLFVKVEKSDIEKYKTELGPVK
jgi:methionyl-tRNA synthetase